jgi:hypothetical protein
MSDDILVFSESEGNADHLEPRDAPEEQVPLADMPSAPNISHRARHAGKTLLEQRMEEFERYLFMARAGSRQSLTPIAESRKPRRF